MANGYLQARFESVPGNQTNTPTLSTKTVYFPLIGFNPELNPAHLTRDDELRGQDDAVPVVTEAYNPEWNIESRAYPDELGFLLRAQLGAPTTTAGNGVITDPSGATIPTGAHRHVWTSPFGPSGSDPQTTQFQARYTAATDVYYKIKGAAVQELQIESPESGGVQVTANGPALYMEKISNPSLTPSYSALSILPFQKSHLTLPSWLSGTSRHESFQIQIATPVESVRTMGIESQFPNVMEKAEGPILITGSIAQRHIDAEDWDALVNATGFTAMARWNSSTVIASSYTYKAWVEMSHCQYVGGGPEALANKRRHGASFNFRASNNGSAATTITVVNATSSYL
jgi:hypothetical protein